MNLDKFVFKINFVSLLKVLLIKKNRRKLHEFYYSLKINKNERRRLLDKQAGGDDCKNP